MSSLGHTSGSMVTISDKTGLSADQSQSDPSLPHHQINGQLPLGDRAPRGRS